MKKISILLLLFGSLCGIAQNAFWSNNGLVSVKGGEYISVIGDCYNQGNGIYDNSDSIFLTGNWQHDANNRCFDSIGNGWVYLYAADQRIKGTKETHFYNLILKNQGVKYGDLDVYVDGNLELTDREFYMDTNTAWVLNPELTSVKRTTGFVSSLQDGGLLRRTNLTQTYLFPVGSNAGTPRYRPIEFNPAEVNINHYKARFANIDPTLEGFDRAIKNDRVCQINPNWYHRLFHQYGSDSADITILYDELADGTWNDIAHWQYMPEWDTINRDLIAPGTPFNRISKFKWNNYLYSPFALAITSPLTFSADTSNVTCYQAANGFILVTIKNADTTYTVQWSTNDTTANIYNLGPGTYTINIAEANTCSTSASYIITQPQPLASSIAHVDDSCYRSANASITLTVTGGTPQYSFLWNTGDTTRNLSQIDGGTYTVLITDSFHCKHTDSVFIYEPPQLLFAGATSNVTCYNAADGFVLLDIIFADSTYKFKWSNAETTEDIYHLGPGNYTLTITEWNNCRSTATYTITQPPLLTSSIVGTEDSCYLSTNATATLTVLGGTPQYSFLWSNGDTTQNIGNIRGGEYTVIVTDSFHCRRLDSVFIYEPPPIPYAIAGVDTMIWRKDTIQLNGFLAPYYNWFPNHNLSCADCSNPLAWPDSNIVYRLTMMDERGCHYYDTVRIFVRDRPFSLFFIPNAITPNGDGYNDYWNISDLERYPDNEVRIINRWGDEVYFAAPYKNDWIGTWKGENLPGATYYYVLKIKFNGENVQFDGPLTIVR